MKILIISSLYEPYIGGGAEISNKLLAEGLTRNGVEVEVVTLGEENKIEIINGVKIRRIYLNETLKKYLKSIKNKKIIRKSIKKDKVILYIYRVLFYFNFLYKKRIINILQEIKPNLIHTTGIHYFFPQLWWKEANKKGIKVIHTLRDPVFLRLNKSKILSKAHREYFKKYLAKYVDLVHAPSFFMLRKHKEFGFIFKNEKVIYNTLEILPIKSTNKKYDVIYVGSLTEDKGVKILSELKILNIKLICVGEGELRQDLEKKDIEVTGWVSKEEVYKYIQQSKILVLPSEWEEAFGRVLIEGVMNGTLVIGSNQGAIPEVLGNKKEYIFETKNIDKLYKKVKRILNLSSKEYEKEIEIMQNYMTKYNYNNHINNFIKLYSEVLNKE